MRNKFDSSSERPLVKGRGKPTLNKESYEILLGIFAEDKETPSTEIGVFIANSTKRSIKEKVLNTFSIV